jgi:hypothetical protein
MIHGVSVFVAGSQLDRLHFDRPLVLSPSVVRHRDFHPVVRQAWAACSAASDLPRTELPCGDCRRIKNEQAVNRRLIFDRPSN